MTNSTFAVTAALSALLLAPVTVEACTDTQEGVFIGSICMVTFNFCPRGYLEANGMMVSTSEHTALFSLLGTTYGGNGTSVFALPDLRGRVPLGVGQGVGLTDVYPGEAGGVERVALTSAEMPTHNHTATTDVSTASASLKANASLGTASAPGGNALADTGRSAAYGSGVPDVTLAAGSVALSGTATTTVANTGSGQAHENRQPYLAVRYCIAAQGIFPSL